jgi:cytochrome c-type biogenesis protein CcmH
MSTILTGGADATARRTSHGRRKRRFPWWTLFGVVAVVALVIGSGVLGSSAPTAGQRAVAIETDIRCPSCEDLSVVESSAPTAVAVRATVQRQIAEGRSDQQIEAYLISRYGASIELDPPASGWSLLVWLAPLLAGVGGLTVVTTVLIRRHLAVIGGARGGDEGPVDDDAERPTDPDRLADRRAFLVRSLSDADAEYLAGDLSDRDYLALRRRDMQRLAALDANGSSGPPRSEAPAARSAAGPAVGTAPAASSSAATASTAATAVLGAPATPAATSSAATAERPRRRRRSWWFLAGAVAAFTAALIVAVTQFSSNRLPGQTPTGSVSLSPSQQTEETLTQAASDEDQGQIEQAASLYQDVLDQHPANELALAQLGWIEFETGHQTGDRSLLADARAKLDRAVKLDPQDYAARLYLGTVLLQQDGDASAAVAQFALFHADGPPAALVSSAASVIRQAYIAAGQPVPAWLPASS